MKKTLLLFLAGCLALVLSACAAEVLQPPSGEEIVGVWRQGETVYHLQFNADGTFQAADSVSGLASEPIDFGIYELDGSRFTFISSAESPICPGHTGIYQIELDTQGRIILNRNNDQCPERQADPIPPLIRVSP